MRDLSAEDSPHQRAAFRFSQGEIDRTFKTESDRTGSRKANLKV